MLDRPSPNLIEIEPVLRASRNVPGTMPLPGVFPGVRGTGRGTTVHNSFGLVRGTGSGDTIHNWFGLDV